MDTEDIDEKLRGLRPRGAPADLREQVLKASPQRGNGIVRIGAMAAVWLLLGISQWAGARKDDRIAEGAAPMSCPPPVSQSSSGALLASHQSSTRPK